MTPPPARLVITGIVPTCVRTCYSPVMADETVSVRQFRARLSELLARANAGETITVTRAGRIDAELGPPTLEENDDDAG